MQVFLPPFPGVSGPALTQDVALDVLDVSLQTALTTLRALKRMRAEGDR
jgi:hypothetical protein